MKKDRKNKKLFVFLCLMPVIVLFFGCDMSGDGEKASENGDSLAIMTWNVQSLFDDVEDGTEYADFSGSAGWTPEKYMGRINVIAAAIGSMERKPDVIALQEVESAKVVADLAGALAGYGWTHFASIPGMSLGLGLISRFPLSEMKSHTVTVFDDTAPRPMLEAKVSLPSGSLPEGAENGESGSLPVVLFVCHWKSKLGGDDKTESTRRASARIIIRRMRELLAAEPDTPVIIMGDLNENHDEFYRRSGSVISALLPDDPRSAELTGFLGIDRDGPGISAIINELQKDFLIISKSKPPLTKYFPSGVVAVYSPWAFELQNGSYYYKNSWETIDHFLLSQQLFSGSGLVFSGSEVVNYHPFANTNGYPVAYNPRTGNGMSDHLPLLLILEQRP